MLLNAKKLAFLGLILAFDVVLIVLSGVLEFNTLFLLAGASFCVGIAIRETNKQYGFGFFLASIVLGLLLAPNKLYCITYSAMGLYLVMIEYSYDKLTGIKDNVKRRKLFWVIKYVVFNVMYFPMVLLLPKLIYQGEINTGLIAIILAAGQIVLFVYDRAYEYFQRYVWGRVRSHLKL